MAQRIEGFQSVSVGIWAHTGSANETNPSEHGITHFIEHMLFKGTKHRSAEQIAQEFDGMGGILNAFTSKELTCYHARVSMDKLRESFEILADLIINANMDLKEMEKEKGVVIEEINMNEDTPDNLVHDLLAKAYFKDHALALPILGNRDSVGSFTREKLIEYMQKRYTASSMVVAAAGGLDFESLCAVVEEELGDIQKDGMGAQQYPDFQPGKGDLIMLDKPVEQAHLCLAMPGYSVGDDRIYALSILNNVFGGSMSSRLFQTIREQRGLAYDIYSHPTAYQNCGTFSIYAGVNSLHAAETIKLIVEQMHSVLQEGITQQEFVRAKEQLKGNYILGLESTGSRMNAIGKAMTLVDKITTAEENIEHIAKTTFEDVMDIVPYVFDIEKVSASAVGKIDQNEIRTVFEGIC